MQLASKQGVEETRQLKTSPAVRNVLSNWLGFLFTSIVAFFYLHLWSGTSETLVTAYGL